MVDKRQLIEAGDTVAFHYSDCTVLLHAIEQQLPTLFGVYPIHDAKCVRLVSSAFALSCCVYCISLSLHS